ncbi:MAG: hypothetical protein J6A98_02655 [Clostridia bacterium]|nr:hypothetical protein [Clostridia bacterium]
MKKLFTFLLVLCLWVPLTGFSNITSGAVVYSSGQVKEVVSITISQQDAEAANTTLDGIVDAVQSVMPLLKLDLQDAFKNKVNNDPDVNPADFQNAITVDATLQTEETHAQIGLVITYGTMAQWQYFCNTEAIETTTKESLFVTNYFTKSPIRFAMLYDNGTQKNTVQFVYDNLSTRLEEYVADIQNILTTEYSYTYAFKANRVHSDADLVEYDNATGITYYTWDCTLGQDKNITFWQTRANVIVWYVLALAITGGLGLVLWLSSKNKNEENAQ